MKEFEEGFASSQTPSLPEAKVGFAAIQEMARLQEEQINVDGHNDENPSMDSNHGPHGHLHQNQGGGCDLSFLRFDPQSNRMTLESVKSPTSLEKPAKFPLEIPTPTQSPNIGHRLRRMGSWRFAIFFFFSFFFHFFIVNVHKHIDYLLKSEVGFFWRSPCM